MELDRKLLAFTPKNAAILGVSDDFYDLYLNIMDRFEEELLQKQAERTSEGQYYIYRFSLEQLKTAHKHIKKDMYALLEPVLLKHSALFVEPPQCVHATGRLITNLTPYELKPDPLYPKLHYKKLTYDNFLTQLERWIIVSLSFRTRNEKRPKYYNEVFEEVNDRLCTAIEDADRGSSIARDPMGPVFAQNLHVFGRLSLTTCFKNRHPLEARKTYTFSFDGKRIVVLPTHYCPLCKKNMIGQKTLSLFDRTYGRTLAFRRAIPNTGCDYSKFQSETELHQLGYNVSETRGLTDAERLQLLTFLITNDILPYSEICKTIENDLLHFESNPRMMDAMVKWENDLRAIGEFVLSNRQG